MPAVSKSQQRLMGADLARSRAGKQTQTGMSQKQLTDYASTKTKGLPNKKKKKPDNRPERRPHAQTSSNVGSPLFSDFMSNAGNS